MRYVFGPVPSRRLGQSLGVDTVPLKTCNWNCVYCQLGRSRPVVKDRKSYYPAHDIVREVDQALAAHRDNGIDWVTFTASGEGTLHRRIGWLIRQIKAITPLPVAVITNGSLLYRPQVRDELAAADAVMPSLDAGSAALYRRINRPHPSLGFDQHVQGLIDFRRQYRGKLWVEVMLVGGVNDAESALKDLAETLRRIEPDEVHLLAPTRPPAEDWVRAPDNEGLMRASAILGQVARVITAAGGEIDLRGDVDITDCVAAVIRRHPLRDEDLRRALHQQAPEQANRVLAELAGDGRAQVVTRHGVRFWTAAAGHYGMSTKPHRREVSESDP
jgi:wyosine [tRNA(Phe)-imidazoG37] synthetase (radical SAM superfamily)